jgi:membrane protein implicated in regulation of membrane protease activity
MEVIFGWLIRTLSKFLLARFPGAAEGMGLGNERTEALSTKRADLIGRIGHVETAIKAGQGQVKIDGIVWLSEGEDVAGGNAVRVIRVVGNRLVVERA